MKNGKEGSKKIKNKQTNGYGSLDNLYKRLKIGLGCGEVRVFNVINLFINIFHK